MDQFKERFTDFSLQSPIHSLLDDDEVSNPLSPSPRNELSSDLFLPPPLSFRRGLRWGVIWWLEARRYTVQTRPSTWPQAKTSCLSRRRLPTLGRAALQTHYTYYHSFPQYKDRTMSHIEYQKGTSTLGQQLYTIASTRRAYSYLL